VKFVKSESTLVDAREKGREGRWGQFQFRKVKSSGYGFFVCYIGFAELLEAVD